MALYQCEVVFEIIVDAKNHDKAMELATDNIHEELSTSQPEPLEISAKKIVDISNLPEEWIKSIPWNDENHGQTCLEVLAGVTYEQLECNNCKNTTELVKHKNKIMCKTCVLKSITKK